MRKFSFTAKQKQIIDHSLLVLTLLLGFTGTWQTHQALNSAAEAQQSQHLSAAGQSIVDSFDVAISNVNAAIRSTALMIETKEGITRQSFTAYSNSLLANNKAVRFLEWQPVVPASELAQFEAYARTQGFTDFKIREPQGDHLIAARPRDEYVPVLFAWPENTAVIGLDMAFDPARMTSKYQARDSGLPVASAIFDIISTDAIQSPVKGFAISAAVYQKGPHYSIAARRKNLLGYVAGVIEMPDLLREAAFRADAAHIDLQVVDISDNQQQLVFSTFPDANPTPHAAHPNDKTLIIEVGARPWHILLHPRSTSSTYHRFFYGSGALIIGSLATLLLCFTLFLQQRGRRKLEITQAATLLTEAELASEREHLSNILDGTNAGSWYWNVQTGEVILNERWAEMIGYTLKELSPINIQTFLNHTDPQDHPNINAALDLHFNGEKPYYECEFRMRHKQGNTIWIAAHGRLFSTTDEGKPEWIAGTHLDITARKLAEQRLHDSELFLRNLTDVIPGMVAYWTKDLKCGYANAAYKEWFGREKDEMLELSLPELLSHSVYQLNKPYIDAVLAGEAQHFERTLIKTDGSIGHTWAHYLPYYDGEDIHGFFVQVTDITEIKQTQIQLEKLNQVLEQRTLEAETASKAKSDFLATMSHEIRTPMNGILGMVKLLQHTALTKRQFDYASKIESASNSLLGIINDVLDFSKIEAGKMSLEEHPFQLDRLMRDLSVILSANLGDKALEIMFSIDPDLPVSFIGDALRIKQVLLNLAGNAVKFTHQGEVLISLQIKQIESSFTEISFAVRDTGIGISKDKLQYIFEGFSQAESSTTRRFGGTGLGLAISKKLVELMGGQLRIESELGVGSCFYFDLRLKNASASTTKPLFDNDTLNKHGKDYRVLLVEDNDKARDVIKTMMHSLGWYCDLATDSDEALAILRASEALDRHYDIIFIDWTLPEEDGWLTAQYIHQLTAYKQTPVIMLITAHGRELLAKKMRKEQAAVSGFIVKPVTASMLFDAVIDATAGEAGRIQVQPHLGQGTQRLQGMRLLLVEDNLLNQQVASELLSNEGAIVDIANDGQEGVERTLAADPLYDAILMDIQMPGMDGYEATRHIIAHERFSQLPIIAMTANAMESDITSCLEAGMNDHISKPIDLDRLVNTLIKHVYQIEENTAPAPSQQQADELDFDFANAFQRVGSNADLWQTITRTFTQETPKLPEALRINIEKNAQTDAIRQLHTLKGTAGTLGAMALSRLAAQYEAQLRTDFAQIDLTRMLNELSAQIAHSCQAIQTWLTTQGYTPSVEHASPLAFDKAQWLSHLDKLISLLQIGDMNATQVIADVCTPAAQEHYPVLAEMSEAVKQLDFESALRLCHKLKASL